MRMPAAFEASSASRGVTRLRNCEVAATLENAEASLSLLVGAGPARIILDAVPGKILELQALSDTAARCWHDSCCLGRSEVNPAPGGAEQVPRVETRNNYNQAEIDQCAA